jgi:hypothetical protein
MRMRLPNLLQLILQLIDQIVLGSLDLLDGLFDGAEGLGVDVRGFEDFVELEVLDLHVLVDGCEFFLQDEVVQAGFLVDAVHGVVEHVE